MLRRLAPPAPPPYSQDRAEREVLAQEPFLRLLRKERVRADRTGDELTLAAIRLTAIDPVTDPGVRHAVESILGRIRCLDEVGWLRRGTLGILLPATSVTGAKRLIDDLRRNDTTGHLRHGRWTIYAYPEDWVVEDDQGGVSNGDGKGSPRRSSEPGTTVFPRNGRHEPDSESGLYSVKLGPEGRQGPAVQSLVDLLQVPVPAWKRALDILGASIGLLVTSPLMLACAVGVKLSSPGPVFYTSTRSGLRGRPFRFYKFRTMYADAESRKQDLLEHNEASGPVFKMNDDPRITPFGRLLRRTSIDEFPQFWNVLKGDMSLVGPRPPIPEETRYYTQWQRRRLEGRGGLTCIWQVSGRSNVHFEDWVRMDIKYLEGHSFWRDVLILLQTFPAVFSCRGAK
jgi:lipopolysaccharide/colanic/teichoic acid biosynthesis glycosyltransferase